MCSLSKQSKSSLSNHFDNPICCFQDSSKEQIQARPGQKEASMPALIVALIDRKRAVKAIGVIFCFL